MATAQLIKVASPLSATVYIVDDDDAVREALTLLVNMQGWTPVPCASARAFLQAYAGQRTACLLLDLSMKDMSGADLLEQIFGTPTTLPTIVITAHEDHPMATRAMVAGARALVIKPFRNDEIVRLIEDALANGNGNP